jgi:hypothetical protein
MSRVGTRGLEQLGPRRGSRKLKLTRFEIPREPKVLTKSHRENIKRYEEKMVKLGIVYRPRTDDEVTLSLQFNISKAHAARSKAPITLPKLKFMEKNDED